jgi:PKD repeat protein
MASLWSNPQSRTSARGRCWAALRMVLFAATLGLALNALALLPGGGTGAAPVAYACGLVNPYTILANGVPALAYPGSLDLNPSAKFVPPPANGVLADQYVAGQPVKFVEDLSRVPNPPDLSSLQIRWVFGDGTAPSTDVSPSHTFAKPGTYVVALQQYDSYVNPPWDIVDSAQIDIAAASLANPPVAHITADKTAIVVNDSITFDAAGSRAAVGTHLTYQWNFNDGTKIATGAHITHQFSVPGSTFVALTVTDDRGARAVATLAIGIVTDKQQIPTASLSASSTDASAGQQITFDASQSAPASEPAGDQIVKYTWDFGDGTPTQTTPTPSNTHTFQKAGHYTVTVQAVDQQGIPAQATLAMTISAAVSTGSGAAGPSWLAYGGGALVLLVLLVAGYFWVQTQRTQARVERQRLAALELRRARRVPQGGVRPGDPRWGDPRAGDRGASKGATSGAARSGTPRRGPPSSGR